jgi:hypothetical protein
MSTLKVSSIQNPSTSSGGVSIDTSGNVTLPRVSSINDGQLAGFRNRIMNGYMRVDERNADAGISTGVATVTYGIDRWFGYATGAALTMERVNGTAPGFEKSLRIFGAGGNTGLIIGQHIEANNVYALAGQQVTLSFYVATSGSLPLRWKIMIPNTANDFSNLTLGVTDIVATTGATARYSATFTMPAGATKGVSVQFGIDNGLTTGSIDITGVQLEPGSVATPYEYRPIGTELALCQRYYSRLQRVTLARWVGGGTYGGGMTHFTLPQTMRGTPSVTRSVNSGNYDDPTFRLSSTDGAVWFSSGTTIGDQIEYTLKFDSEL